MSPPVEGIEPGVGDPSDIEWDDELWDLLWERQLNAVERHSIAMDVLRGREVQGDPLEQEIGRELANRWRQRARNLALLYGFWTLFWGLLAVDRWRDPDPDPLVSLVAAMIGLVAIGACFVFRWYMRTYLREHG